MMTVELLRATAEPAELCGEAADNMLGLCREAAPELFRRAGCACMKNLPCPEGKRSCGHPRAVHKGV